MTDVLDNPVWHALDTGNSNLAKGNGDVKYFDIEVSPFVAMRDVNTESFNELYTELPAGRINFLAHTQLITLPPQWKLIACVHGYQMVHDQIISTGEPDIQSFELSTEHADDMISLAKLTNPGPFSSRTIEFGYYRGIWHDSKLIAMAGQRMQPFNYAEVSAVCTHPDHAGKGYARQLLAEQIERIRAAEMIPFLHVKYDNERAVKLYERLGFVVRSDMYFYIFKKR